MINYQAFLASKRRMHRMPGIDPAIADTVALFPHQRALTQWAIRIGSEGYVALELGRRFVGVELKASYYRHAAENLHNVGRQTSFFDATSA